MGQRVIVERIVDDSTIGHVINEQIADDPLIELVIVGQIVIIQS